MDPEGAAINILRIFVDTFNRVPGESLLINSINENWKNYSTNDNDLSFGLVYAVNNNWIEVKKTGNFVLTLTDVGHSILK